MSDRYIDQIIEEEDRVIVVAKDRDGGISVGTADREHHSNGLRDAIEEASDRALNQD